MSRFESVGMLNYLIWNRASTLRITFHTHKVFTYQMSTAQKMNFLSKISYLPFAKLHLKGNFEMTPWKLLVDI